MIEFERLDNPSPYVLAGAQTLPNILSPLVDGGYASSDTVNKVMLDTMDKLLVSFGANLSYKTKKLSDKYLERFCPQMEFVNDPMFKNCITYIDSGGFQIAMGALESKDVERFTDYYIKLIEQHGDFVFSMDVPPTTDANESYEEIYIKNKFTYDKLSNLPESIRNKILAVFHFRTTKIYETWNRLFEEGDYFNKFKVWSIGGLVGFGSMASKAGIVPYIIPIAKLVKTTYERKEKDLYIHILGSTAPNDMLLYILLKLLIKERFDINLYMTFDSSKIYKGIIRGKYFEVLRDGSSYQIPYKSSHQNIRFHKLNKTPNQILYEEIDVLCSKYGMKPLEHFDDIYTNDTPSKPIRKNVQAFIALQTFLYSKQLFEHIQISGKELYETYKIDKNKFVTDTISLLRDLNKAHLTESVKGKSFSIKNSLEFFEKELTDQEIASLIGRIFNKHELHKIVDTSIISW